MRKLAIVLGGVVLAACSTNAPPPPAAPADINNVLLAPGFLAHAPVQNAPAVATAQNGHAVHAYVANSSRGTWLFAPNQNGGGNQG